MRGLREGEPRGRREILDVYQPNGPDASLWQVQHATLLRTVCVGPLETADAQAGRNIWSKTPLCQGTCVSCGDELLDL